MSNNSYEDLRIMDVDRGIWKSFILLISMIGKWWLSVWILTLLAGIVSLSLTVLDIKLVNISVWIILIILGFVLAPSVSFHFLRIEKDKFNKLWEDKNHIISILTELEKLRVIAASLQIEGMNLPNDRIFNKWKIIVEHWTSITYDKINLLHPAEAGNFNTLGLFKPEFAGGTNFLSDEHANILKNFIRRIHILEEIRNRWVTRRG